MLAPASGGQRQDNTETSKQLSVVRAEKEKRKWWRVICQKMVEDEEVTCTWGTKEWPAMPGARTGVSGREKVKAIKTAAMVATPTPYHLPVSTQGPVPTPGITQVSVLEPRVRAVALAQAASHRHNLGVSQGQGSVHRVLVPYVH